MAQLENGEIDLAFLPHDKPFSTDYRAVKIADFETVCCVSPVHSLVKHRKISVRELYDQPLVLFKNSFFQTEALLQRFQSEDLRPKVLLYTDQLSTVRRIVARNLAVGFMFSSLSDSITDVISIPLDPPMAVRVSLVWKADSYVSRDQEAFVHLIQQTVLAPENGTLCPKK